MFCEGCGAELSGDSSFCEHCGKPVQSLGPTVPVAQQQPITYPVATRAKIAGPMTLGGKPLSSIIIITTMGFCGLLVFISTFMAWVSGSVVGQSVTSSSGWEGVIHPGPSANFLFAWSDGIFMFSGFWSMILGLALVGCAVLLFIDRPIGGILSIVVGAVGFFIAMVDIVMVYTRVSSMLSEYGNISVHPGTGLWVLLLFSIGAAVTGILNYTSG